MFISGQTQTEVIYYCYFCVILNYKQLFLQVKPYLCCGKGQPRHETTISLCIYDSKWCRKSLDIWLLESTRSLWL